MKYTIQVDEDKNCTVTCTTQSKPDGALEAHAVIFTGKLNDPLGKDALDAIKMHADMWFGMITWRRFFPETEEK